MALFLTLTIPLQAIGIPHKPDCRLLRVKINRIDQNAFIFVFHHLKDLVLPLACLAIFRIQEKKPWGRERANPM